MISGAGLPKAAHVREICLPPYSKEPFGCETRVAGSRAADVDSRHNESVFTMALQLTTTNQTSTAC